MTGRNLLYATSLIFVTIGVITFCNPQLMIELLGFKSATLSGLNETRANYGGMMVGIGIFIAFSARNDKRIQLGWLLVALLCGGLVVGRVWSILLDGLPQTLRIIAFAGELFLTLISIWMYRQGVKRQSSLNQHQ